jgi:hypothetical protein
MLGSAMIPESSSPVARPSGWRLSFGFLVTALLAVAEV